MRWHRCASAAFGIFFLYSMAGAQPLYHLTDLGTLGGNGAYSSTFAINNAGAVTGYSGSTSAPNHAFYWTSSSGMIDMGAPAGSNASVGKQISALGHVVGYASTHQ